MTICKNSRMEISRYKRRVPCADIGACITNWKTVLRYTSLSSSGAQLEIATINTPGSDPYSDWFIVSPLLFLLYSGALLTRAGF